MLSSDTLLQPVQGHNMSRCSHTLRSSADLAARAGLDRFKVHAAEGELLPRVLGVGRRSGSDNVRPEALHGQLLRQVRVQLCQRALPWCFDMQSASNQAMEAMMHWHVVSKMLGSIGICLTGLGCAELRILVKTLVYKAAKHTYLADEEVRKTVSKSRLVVGCKLGVCQPPLRVCTRAALAWVACAQQQLASACSACPDVKEMDPEHRSYARPMA